MTDIAFGLFDHVEQRAGQAPHETYAGRIRLVQAAEQAGFHAYQVAEHHFTPLGLAPSPSLFLAALAPATQRIRLGSLVHLLPLYAPVRLIEEICMLDQLSGGRLELGIGRGVSPFELGHYGVDFLASRESFEETLTALIAGLTQPHLHASGQQFHYRGAPMVMRTVQQPLPPLWYGITSASSMHFAAERGMHVVSLAPNGMLADLMTSYRELRARHRGGPLDLSAAGSVTRLGALRQVYVGASTAEAERVGERAYAVFYANLMHLWRTFNVVNTLIPPTYAAARELGTLIVGTAAAVREQVEALFEASGCNYLAGEFVFGDLSDAEARASIERFGADIMPAFRRTSMPGAPR